MRILLIAVAFVAGCASANQPKHMARADQSVGSQAPRGSVEQSRTGQDVANTPNATPPLMSPDIQPIAPLRDIPPAPPIP